MVGQDTDRRICINAIAQLLDYAIVEGAELRLPVFVFLVRLARLELKNAAPGDFEPAECPRHADPERAENGILECAKQDALAMATAVSIDHDMKCSDDIRI